MASKIASRKVVSRQLVSMVCILCNRVFDDKGKPIAKLDTLRQPIALHFPLGVCADCAGSKHHVSR